MDYNLHDRIPRPQTETYSAGQGKSWVWNALPGPVTSLYSLLATGSITGLAYYFGDSAGGGQGYRWSMIAIVAMTFIGLVVFLVSARRAKRAAKAKAGGFENAVKGSAAGWDTSGSDVQEIARLDDMRAKFQQGIETFNQHGKSLYELPWYVIVGEPSSGKSEAIRRSELRFPQGLQDKLQGVGGTHSMNWWFTNHAVILDTAGAILMDPEAAQRFEEFLKLLRIHRSDYPINGLILTLPVDKLLTDPPHIAEEKARTIAAQLGIVQKALDVRFPLYVMVSKSDRLPGFREFVDAEGQTTFEPQIFGWSNPAPLDEPFDVERLDEALECISARLQRRILSLIADPIARQEGTRRLDEVDSIYSFPQMLRSLKPRLQCYLEVLFQTGTWASKPPFFRGLYFTSAMREGNELDQALAQAMNMDVQKLPTGGLFTQEKAVFLRDLFLTKIFLEKGLVTRLKNVGALLRRRLVTFFAIALSLVALCLLFAWIVRSTIGRQLEKEQNDWYAANETWDNGTVLAVIARQKTDPEAAPRWIWDDGKTSSKELSRFKLVQHLVDMTAANPRMGWVFRPLPEWQEFEQRRRDAAVTVFEASVIKPVLDAARERLLWDTPRTTKIELLGLAEAYEQLALLEAWVVNSKKPSTDDRLSPPNAARWKIFFEKLLGYILGPKDYEEKKVDAAELAKLTDFVYSHQGRHHDRSWMAENAPDTHSSALASTAKLLFGKAADKVAHTEQEQKELNAAKQRLLQRFEGAEKVVFDWSKDSQPRRRDEIEAQGMEPMKKAVQEYQQLCADGKGMPVATLTQAQLTRFAQVTVDVIGATESATDNPLRSSRENANALLGHEDPAAATDNADASCRKAARRFEHYKETFAPTSPEKMRISRSNILGHLGEKLLEAAAAADNLAKPSSAAKAGESPGGTSPEPEVAAYLVTFRGAALVDSMFNSYADVLRKELYAGLKFPLAQGGDDYPNLDQFNQFCEDLGRVEKDMSDPAVANPRFYTTARQPVMALFDQLKPVLALKKIVQTGLRIQFGAIKKAKEVVKPGEPEKKSGGLFGIGRTTIPAVPSSTEVTGITNVTITIGGMSQMDDSPTGQASPLYPWDGYKEIKLSVLKAGNPDPFTEGWGPGWRLLKRIAAEKKSDFPIGNSGTNFSVQPTQPFPSPWPKRNDFKPLPTP